MSPLSHRHRRSCGAAGRARGPGRSRSRRCGRSGAGAGARGGPRARPLGGAPGGIRGAGCGSGWGSGCGCLSPRPARGSHTPRKNFPGLIFPFLLGFPAGQRSSRCCHPCALCSSLSLVPIPGPSGGVPERSLAEEGQGCPFQGWLCGSAAGSLGSASPGDAPRPWQGTAGTAGLAQEPQHSFPARSQGKGFVPASASAPREALSRFAEFPAPLLAPFPAPRHTRPRFALAQHFPGCQEFPGAAARSRFWRCR